MDRSTALLACMIAASALVPLPAPAQDMAVTARENVKVLLDNDRVRVLELQMPPGGKTGMHSHGDNVVHFVTAGETTQTGADGSVTKVQRKAGETLWSGPTTHDTQNTGKTAMKVLVIELKAPAHMH